MIRMRVLVLALVFVSWGIATNPITSEEDRMERAQPSGASSSLGANKDYSIPHRATLLDPLKTIVFILNSANQDFHLMYNDCISAEPTDPEAKPKDFIPRCRGTTFYPIPPKPSISCATHYVTADRKSWFAIYVIVNPSIDMDMSVRSSFDVDVITRTDIGFGDYNSKIFEIFTKGTLRDCPYLLMHAEHEGSTSSRRSRRRHRRPQEAANAIIKG